MQNRLYTVLKNQTFETYHFANNAILNPTIFYRQLLAKSFQILSVILNMIHLASTLELMRFNQKFTVNLPVNTSRDQMNFRKTSPDLSATYKTTSKLLEFDSARAFTQLDQNRLFSRFKKQST